MKRIVLGYDDTEPAKRALAFRVEGPSWLAGDDG